MNRQEAGLKAGKDLEDVEEQREEERSRTDAEFAENTQRRNGEAGLKTRCVARLVICGVAVWCGALRGQTRGEVQVWLTNADKSAVFEEQKPFLKLGKDASREPTAE